MIAGLLAEDARLERLATGFAFAEGPVWHPDGYLLFLDLPQDVRRRWTEAGGVVEVMRPAWKCNGMTLDARLRLVVCEHSTSRVVRATLRPDGTEESRETIASHYRGRELNSPNDVVVRSDGSIYFTDPTYGRMPFYGEERERELDFQGVYRILPEGGGLELLVADFGQPNGLCFSPDESRLYVNDSEHFLIRVFEVGLDGELTGDRLFARGLGDPERRAEGDPDGMRCDELGNVWAAGAGGIWVFDPAGRSLGLLPIPEVPANLTWGGPSRRTLYITATASLYRVETRVAGCPLPYTT